MDYEKAYKAVLKTATQWIKDGCTDKEKICLECVFPELRGSEDERIRRALVEYFGPKVQLDFVRGVPIQKIRDWLEKQKYDRMKPIYDARESFESALEKAWNDYHNGYENVDKLEDDYVECAHAKGFREGYLFGIEKQKENPKNAISIPADCMSDAKCEDRWHKTANSLPDDGRDVLAKDAIGNYLLASFDGAQWFVSVYDGEDHPVLHTPPILEWCEIPSEKQKEQVTDESDKIAAAYQLGRSDERKQKEQKPAEKQDYSSLNDLERAIHRGFLCAGVENVPVTIIKDTAAECMGFLALIEPKPAEWSEEDERIMDSIINILCCYKANLPTKNQLFNVSFQGEVVDADIAWLKSLRPSWKPSEEQMKALENSTALTEEQGAALYSLIQDLKKL